MQVVLVFTAGSSRAVRLADSADTNNSAIDPTWSTWQTMQSKFLQKQTELYGNWTSHYYSVCTDSHLCYTSWTERLSLTSQIDLYNELTPTSLDTAYLQNNTRSVVTSLRNTDPDAVWVMQGWMFVSDTKSWNKTTIPALLSGATDEEMVSTQASRGRDRVRVRRDPGALADGLMNRLCLIWRPRRSQPGTPRRVTTARTGCGTRWVWVSSHLGPGTRTEVIRSCSTTARTWASTDRSRITPPR
jgi:hypothetical protein